MEKYKVMDNILISIICLTYNHEAYIRDAIEGFLAQKVDYKYEIIIHDDASTDDTVTIIKEYKQKYPDIIRCILQKENQYSRREFEVLQDIFRVCRGKYIAFCEGDDYWIDIHKLQMQAEYLEKHSECFIVAHNAIKINNINKEIKPINPYLEERDLRPEEIIMQYKGNLPTASLMFRAEIVNWDKFFLESGIGDWTIQLYSITQGTVHYFDRIMSVYRYMHSGSWGLTHSQNIQKHILHCFRMIDFLKKYNIYTNDKYDKYIISKIQIYISNIIHGKYNLDVEGMIAFCKRSDVESEFKYHVYFEEIMRIYKQVFDEKYISIKMQKFIQEHGHTVIWGIGNYGTLMAKQLKHNNIEFDGFIVSDNQNVIFEYLGKPVWKMRDMEFDENVGVIIAINPVIWNQISDILCDVNIDQYMCPFLLDENLYEKGI